MKSNPDKPSKRNKTNDGIQMYDIWLLDRMLDRF